MRLHRTRNNRNCKIPFKKSFLATIKNRVSRPVICAHPTTGINGEIVLNAEKHGYELYNYSKWNFSE